MGKNAKLLDELGVLAVINASNAYYTLPQAIQRLDVEVDDSPGANIGARLHDCCEFISKYLQAGMTSLR